jgi:hypothetical protein
VSTIFVGEDGSVVALLEPADSDGPVPIGTLTIDGDSMTYFVDQNTGTETLFSGDAAVVFGNRGDDSFDAAFVDGSGSIEYLDDVDSSLGGLRSLVHMLERSSQKWAEEEDEHADKFAQGVESVATAVQVLEFLSDPLDWLVDFVQDATTDALVQGWIANTVQSYDLADVTQAQLEGIWGVLKTVPGCYDEIVDKDKSVQSLVAGCTDLVTTFVSNVREAAVLASEIFETEGAAGVVRAFLGMDSPPDLVTGSQYESSFVAIDVAGTYLTPGENDPANPPTSIQLASIGAVPGSWLVMNVVGDVAYSQNDGPENEFEHPDTSILFVNSVGESLPIGYSTAEPAFTQPTCVEGSVATDMPNDVFISDDPSLVEVPAAAQRLMFSLNDCFWSDNYDYGGDYGIEIVVIQN